MELVFYYYTIKKSNQEPVITPDISRHGLIMSIDIKRYDPAVDKRLLVLLSGLVWSGVGVMLCNLAAGWLTDYAGGAGIYFGLSGIVLSLLIHHFGFLKLVDKNINRISSYENQKICIFAFQERKSYIIVLIMICLGFILRSSPMPRTYLAVIYIGFGGAMLLSSIKYFRVFIKLILSC
jgi:hypothetical protein